MPEHFLHRAQVARGLQQMRCKGMAQHMRMHIGWYADRACMVFNPLLNRSGSDPPAATGNEQRMCIEGCRRAEQLLSVRQPRAYCLQRRSAYGYRATLSPFASDGEFCGIQINPCVRAVLTRLEIMDIEAGQFGYSQAA